VRKYFKHHNLEKRIGTEIGRERNKVRKYIYIIILENGTERRYGGIERDRISNLDSYRLVFMDGTNMGNELLRGCHSK
jgi:hypothetical protein